MRGARLRRRRHDGRHRIIPAHAGSTSYKVVQDPEGGDHPRTCGEHMISNLTQVWVQGSSPHMRGALHAGADEDELHRIIPAHAGSTGTGVTLCGDIFGSSPHMRGAPGEGPRRRGGRRIIPAHAGSTSSAQRGSCSAPDHPRTCGEHCAPVAVEVRDLGSSPHMRGAPALGYAPHARLGIIPAHAGSTPREVAASRKTWDHPRTCGEHTSTETFEELKAGSSPHMRGAHHRGLHLGHEARIIPAHAGSTWRSPSPSTSRTDHPRTCGEHCHHSSACAIT